MAALEVLRLPSERWDQQELAEALTELPHLKTIDEQTYHDLRRERSALCAQCDILWNARGHARGNGPSAHEKMRARPRPRDEL